MGIKQNVRPINAGKVCLLMMKDIKVFLPIGNFSILQTIVRKRVAQ